MPIPFAPGAVRVFLIAQPSFTTALAAANLSTSDLPDPITAPYATLRAVSNQGSDPFLRRPMVQLDVWVPKPEILGGDVHPEEVAWNIAALAGELIGRARSQDFRGAAWRGRWVEGPITFVDTKRGADNPLYRATVRVELHFRAARVTP